MNPGGAKGTTRRPSKSARRLSNTQHPQFPERCETALPAAQRQWEERVVLQDEHSDLFRAPLINDRHSYEERRKALGTQLDERLQPRLLQFISSYFLKPFLCSVQQPLNVLV